MQRRISGPDCLSAASFRAARSASYGHLTPLRVAPSACPHKAGLNEPYSVRIAALSRIGFPSASNFGMVPRGSGLALPYQEPVGIRNHRVRRLANIFLILFLCAGIVSLLDAVVLLFATSSPLAGMRSILALLVGLAAVPMHLCLGIDKRLPKSIFLPQLLFIFWSIFGLWPLPLIFDRTHYMVPATLVQVLLGVAPLLHLKKSGGQWLLPADMFSGPFFGWKHSVTFFVANLIISPLVLVYMVFSFASLQLYEQSGGFARLWPSGLRMTEKIYRCADKEIHLTGMIHIADQAYYDDVLNALTSDRTIVLAEGVTDEDRLLTSRFSYGNLAQGLGLTSQETLVFGGKVIAPEEMQSTPPSTPMDAGYHILRADIDVKAFHPKTIEFLNIIGERLLGNDSFTEGVHHYLAWIKENSPEITPETLMNDILHKRNREVIRRMSQALDHYDTIVIPWGALHMPEIEAAVLEKNFQIVETRQRTSIDFKKMLHAYRARRGKDQK